MKIKEILARLIFTKHYPLNDYDKFANGRWAALDMAETTLALIEEAGLEVVQRPPEVDLEDFSD